MNIDIRIVSLWKAFVSVTAIIGIFSLLEYSGILVLGNYYFGFNTFANEVCGLIFCIVAMVLFVGNARQAPKALYIAASSISCIVSFVNMAYVMVIAPTANERLQIMAIALFLIEAALLLGSIKINTSEADKLNSLIKNKK